MSLAVAVAALVPPSIAAVRGQGAAGTSSAVAGLALEQPVKPGRFFDVVGRRSAVFGYEDRPFECWIYPVKVLDDFRLTFRIDGYPLEMDSRDLATTIRVQPDATTFVYSHAAFTVRQTIVAPLDAAGVLVLLDIDSVLPMRVTGSFRPRLRPMWPAGAMTPNAGWDAAGGRYILTEDSGRFAAAIGSPGARELSLMPYQEEPRDVPLRFAVDVPLDRGRKIVPIVIAGSLDGAGAASAEYDRLVGSISALRESTAAHYRRLLAETVAIDTPDERLNTAFAWAKIGVDKGMATNPLVGRGFLAGFRTSGESERPGYAWFFGRDALWTTLASTAYGDTATTRTALDFLKRYQRTDGKIPHEVSQSATLVPWFTGYPYPWASADATPLYVVAHGDHWQATGDRPFLDASWDSIARAFAFTAATDTDGNGLVENTGAGHGWVEGGALHPAHEEIYLQGVWVAAAQAMAAMADARGDAAAAADARRWAERTRGAVERTYWLEGPRHYAFATVRPRKTPAEAEPGPDRARRQARLKALSGATLIDEDTVLPAVPLWWRLLDPARADEQIDHLGSGRIATDWGARILSETSELYDPLSYHYGSVWPLFTGWAAMASYGYGRPHVGLQAVMSSVGLKETGAIGYVTELLSGRFNAPFGRSSHHQVWSEAMIVTPVLRGLFGIEAGDAGRTLRISPQLPADWRHAAARNVPMGNMRYDIAFARAAGRLAVTIERRGPAPDAAPGGATRIVLAPAFPLDTGIQQITVNGSVMKAGTERIGDVQRAPITMDNPPARTVIIFRLTEGTDVYVRHEAAAPGAESTGLRVLRSRALPGALQLRLEGRGGSTYALRVRTPHVVGGATGVRVAPASEGDTLVQVTFEGAADRYVRRDIALPLRRR
ncbi:MAG: amylo-alpha-1,6-glucosidase [Acidobacteria bacterium]|nr:amylo-alpha-1,6-glucosidase [Acidobacteriota bacterium]